MKSQFNPTRTIAKWLQKRDWFVEREISNIIEDYEKEIEKARIHATNKMIVKLREIRNSAKRDTTNYSITKRERQMSTTEYERLSKEIARLEATIPEGALITETIYR